jgi:catechol 2,3-dioxygenase-like lactoylglutathione lyase family enzyme
MVNETPYAVLEAPRVIRLIRFGLTTQHIERLVGFFAQALDGREIERDRRSGCAFEQLMGVDGGATCVTVALGDALIEILEFDLPGEPYVPHLSPFDNEFQHFGIVVDDMDAAFARLSGIKGWTAISTDGPQQLPAGSGAVKAFKFRDPDGHPMELLSFPKRQVPAHWRARSTGDLFLGIDHSAISCSNAARSVEFYQTLGLEVAAQSFNHGVEQERLDGIDEPQVDVIALAPQTTTPHVEILCYRNTRGARKRPIRCNNISATRLIFESDTESAPLGAGTSAMRILDPDGHHILIRKILYRDVSAPNDAPVSRLEG